MDKKITQVKWLRYKLFCHNRGLAESNYLNFKLFIENHN